MTARKLIFFALGIAALACATAYRGFLELFSVTTFYDDTGYMLSLIKGFNEHGHLYQATFSQYGPFYSELYYFVCGVLGVPITHDGIRWVVLIFWVFSSIAGAILAFRLTGRIWIALLAQALSFHVLESLVGEPGHPLSLVIACFGCLALCLTGGKSEQLKFWQPIAIGTLLGALLMTKINLGIFALAALGTALIYRSPLDMWGKVLRGAAALLFASMVLLIRTGWPVEVRTYFTLLFICSLLSVLISARGQTFDWRTSSRLGLWTLAALLLTCALSLSGAFLTGSGWADLIDGLITNPMRLATVFVDVPAIGPLTATSAVVGLLLAVAWRFTSRAFPLHSDWITFGLRLFFLVLVIVWLAKSSQSFIPVLPFLCPFLWIAALPLDSASRDSNMPAGQFAQLSIVLLAVGQILGLYPVSGAQLGVPIYLGSLCVLFAVAGLLTDLKASARDLFTLRRVAATAAIAGLAIVVLGLSGRVLRLATARYDRFTSLNLPGAKLLRTDEATAATYRFLAENLRGCRPSFLTIPGMNSLYSWSERETPTGFNVTMNFALLSAAQQNAMVTVGGTCQPIAAVLNRRILNFWIRGTFKPSGPLLDFVIKECRSVGRVNNYELMTLRNSPPPQLTYCVTLDKEWRPDAPANQITVSLPANVGAITSASVLQASSSGAPRQLMEATIPSEGTDKVDRAPAAGSRQFSIYLPEPKILSPQLLDQTFIQLKDESAHLINLPFLRPTGRRPSR
jgi:hypothetical protein